MHQCLAPPPVEACGFSRYAEPKETHIFYKELAGAAFAIHEWQWWQE